MKTVRSAASIAASAALLALATAAPTTGAYAKGGEAKVHCYGVNSCKGEGFKEESKAQCATDGGSLTAPQ